jgi:heme exporter protein B
MIFFSQIHRECLLHIRKPLNLLHPWLFFIMVVLLFPFILFQEPQQLKTLLPGLIWISALLAYLLSVEHFFEMDHINGALECLLIYPFPLPLSVLAKTISHWLLTGLPLTLLSPLLGHLVGLSYAENKILCISLLLGTPALSALGTLLGAITLSTASRGLLLGMLLIPLALPLLIFGTGSVLAETMNFSPASSLSFLAAITLAALLGTPFATAVVLRYGA